MSGFENEELLTLALLEDDPVLAAEIRVQVALELAHARFIDQVPFDASSATEPALMGGIGIQAGLLFEEQAVFLPPPLVHLLSVPSYTPESCGQRSERTPAIVFLLCVLGALAVTLLLAGNYGAPASRSVIASRNKSSSSAGPMALPTDTTHYTRAQWATDLLKAIGNSNPSLKTMYWVVGWTDYESSAGGAAYNLLNTTQRMPGSWNFNSGGVQNFTSYSQGIQANAIVLENGYYPVLLAALRSNSLASLTTPPASMQSELGTWGTGWRSWGFSGVRANQTFS